MICYGSVVQLVVGLPLTGNITP